MRIRQSVLLITAAVAVLAAAACGSEGEAATTTTKRTTTTTEPVPLGFMPLTGEALFEVEDVAAAQRPAVTVKVDNTPKARPQAGLEAADVIIEERIEGGSVRLLAIFHSDDADSVGPIRSVRSSDPPIVHPFGGVFVYSGGIPSFDRAAKALPLATVTESNHAAAFHYRNDRRRPLKTYSDTSKLRTYALDGATAPGAFTTFLPEGEPFAPASAEAVEGVRVVFGSRTSGEFSYNSRTKRWLRSSDGAEHDVASGKRLAVTNVIVQFVPYQFTGERDGSGSQVDKAIVVGEGDAWIFSQGKLTKGRWSKPAESDMTTFTDSAGNPISLPPGKTWVSLPAVGSNVTVTADEPDSPSGPSGGAKSGEKSGDGN